MTSRTLVLVALVAGVLGFFLGMLFTRSSSAGRGSGLDVAPTAAVEAEIAELRSEVAAYERRADEATRRATEAEEALAALLPGESGTFPGLSGEARTARGSAPGETGNDAGGARFFETEYAGSLATVNWSMVGKNIAEMVDLLRSGAPLIARGESMPDGMVQRIQRLVSPVLAATIQVRDQLPGRGISEKFSSAPFAANAIAAALEAGGVPLDEGQADRVLAAARALLAGDAERLAGYDDETFALEQILDEADLKDRFYTDVFAVLSPAQRDVLRSDETANRIRLDFFSPAQLFGRRTEVFTFRDEQHLTAIMEGRVAKSLRLNLEQRRALVEDYRRWTANLPRDLLFAEPDELDRRGMVTADRATAWARQELDLYRTLAASPALTENHRRAFRGVSNVLVPLPE